ncbi:MAG: CPBP family intramembrane glutamic endopeptidase [Niallia sp.]|nr:CAAX amino terminal protease self-immunity [Mycobacteroides abscessus subsp. abscessus]HEO8422268.1 CPBP family intramembrane metalloprotease [Yersinia enterocolitica]
MKLKKYITITFLFSYFSWGIVIIYTQILNTSFNTSILPIIFYILGVISPAISAVIINKNLDSKEEFKFFIKNSSIPPKKISEYFFIFVVTVLFQLIPFYLIGGEQTRTLLLLLLQFPIYIVIGGLEEIGWRGLMLPELEKRLSLFISTLVIGVVWSLWHLPLFFIMGTYQYEFLNFFTFTLNTISFSFVLSVIFYKTRSIFLCIITHALLNSLSAMFIIKESLAAELIILLLSLLLFVLITSPSRKSQ